MNCLLLIGLLDRYWFVLMIFIKETVIAESVSLINTTNAPLFLSNFKNESINGFSVQLSTSYSGIKEGDFYRSSQMEFIIQACVNPTASFLDFLDLACVSAATSTLFSLYIIFKI